jgi:hypothetical protein
VNLPLDNLPVKGEFETDRASLKTRPAEYLPMIVIDFLGEEEV